MMLRLEGVATTVTGFGTTITGANSLCTERQPTPASTNDVSAQILQPNILSKSPSHSSRSDIPNVLVSRSGRDLHMASVSIILN